METITAPKGFTFIYEIEGEPMYYKPLTENIGVLLGYKFRQENQPYYLACLADKSILTEYDIDKVYTPKGDYGLYFYTEENGLSKLENHTFIAKDMLTAWGYTYDKDLSNINPIHTKYTF